MKKITMITAIFLLVLSATFADKVISADQLSVGAKDQQHTQMVQKILLVKPFPEKPSNTQSLISALMKLFSTTAQKST